MQRIRIGERAVGDGQPVFIVAELSANHLQSYERAAELVRAAAVAGADAVKLQTYTADTITLDVDGPLFRIGGNTPWEGERLYDIYERAHTPWDWQPRLMDLARECGIQCFSAPFDPTAVDFLEKLGAPAYKIASFELVDLALIERCARTGKPVILSTGMASLDEIADALAAARAAGSGGVALLKCTSAYPSPPEALRLRAIEELARRFDVPVGLSDHTLDVAVAVAAVTLGACIVERHLTLRRADGGPDAAFSLEPAELAEMVRAIRLTERALGSAKLGHDEAEREMLRFRRSLFVVRDMAEGDVFTRENVRSVRPGAGLAPKLLPEVIGRRAARALARGTPLAMEHIAPLD
jgi:N-acetylneuraminate synthase